jgi:hypothetical protein
VPHALIVVLFTVGHRYRRCHLLHRRHQQAVLASQAWRRNRTLFPSPRSIHHSHEGPLELTHLLHLVAVLVEWASPAQVCAQNPNIWAAFKKVIASADSC